MLDSEFSPRNLLAVDIITVAKCLNIVVKMKSCIVTGLVMWQLCKCPVRPLNPFPQKSIRYRVNSRLPVCLQQMQSTWPSFFLRQQVQENQVP